MDFISAQFVMCCPCATPHTSFNINALAIMQGLQNSEQNYNIKGWQLAILDFIYMQKMPYAVLVITLDVLIYITA